jgi:perosamine synthetase
MDEVLAIAERHGLAVIEDCAHALGATYRGQPVGTLGDAALFSFQVLKPLNTLGGGMAFTRDAEIGERLAAMAGAERWPTERAVRARIRTARLERLFMQPAAFSLTGYPLLLAASLARARADVYLWEKVRALDPFPPAYGARYTNVQAALGLAGLDRLDEWNERARANARLLSRRLAGLPGVVPPPEPCDRVHVYYSSWPPPFSCAPAGWRRPACTWPPPSGDRWGTRSTTTRCAAGCARSSTGSPPSRDAATAWWTGCGGTPRP